MSRAEEAVRPPLYTAAPTRPRPHYNIIKQTPRVFCPAQRASPNSCHSSLITHKSLYCRSRAWLAVKTSVISADGSVLNTSGAGNLRTPQLTCAQAASKVSRVSMSCRVRDIILRGLYRLLRSLIALGARPAGPSLTTGLQVITTGLRTPDVELKYRKALFFVE